MDTVEEQPVEENTLDQDIAAAFDAIDSEEETDAPKLKQEIEEEVEAIPEEQDEKVDADAEVIEQSAIIAPDHWDAAHKDMFNGWDDGVKTQYMERHKEMEGRMTQGLQEVSELKTEFGEYQEKFASQRGNLQRAGLSTSQYLENLTNADLMLNRDPIAGIKQIAQMYNVDLNGSNFMAQESSEDPALNVLRSELQELRSAVDQGKADDDIARQSGFEQQIQDFSIAKDDAGQLIHPYLEDVMGDMVNLALVERNQGRAPDLAKIYEQAVWSNPTTREKTLSANKADQEAQNAIRAREKAAKAKAASASPSGNADVSGAHVSLSLEQELSALYDS